jgi:DNA-directed RNA polymerase subunit RPC12/RpoP
MVEIECLACGKTISMPPFIDTEKYEGQIVCQECKSILHVKLVKGKVQKYKIVEDKSKFNWTDFFLSIQKEENQQEKGDND